MLHDLMLLSGRRQFSTLIAFVTFPRTILSKTLIGQDEQVDHRHLVTRKYCQGYCGDPCYRYLEYGIGNFTRSLNLFQLLHVTRNLKCQDPRDRIYGILSMVKSWDGNLPIEPDYTARPLNVAFKGMMVMSTDQEIHRVLYLADILVRSMMLHLNDKPPRITTPEIASIWELDYNHISLYDGYWAFCGFIHGTCHPGKLHIKSLSSYHKDRNDSRQRFSSDILEGGIPEGYHQVMDSKGDVIALLPRGTQPGDCLVTNKGLHFDDKDDRADRFRYLVLRKSELRLYIIIGQAIVVGNRRDSMADFGSGFYLRFGAQDALNLVISWNQCPAYEDRDFQLFTWDMAKELLDLKVCSFPGCSWAEEK